jgi:putative phage-type endonuclease
MALSEADAKRLGGSDMAALVGLSPWATPLTVYARIVAGAEIEDSPSLRRGRLMEPVIRAMYEQDEGVTLLGPTSLAHPSHAFVRASLDDVGRRQGRGRHAVEYKSVTPNKAGEWGEPGTDDIPAYYATQAHWYLGVGLASGALDEPTADVAALMLGVEESPRVYRVVHDAEVYAWLLEAAGRFWRDHVLPQRPPPPTMPAREAEAVRRLYRAEREPLAHFPALPPEERAAVLAYAEARRAAKEASDAADAAEVRLKLALGWRAGVESLPPDSGLQRVTWTSDRHGKVSWKAAFESLARETGAAPEVVQSVAEKCRGEPGRTLRAAETKEEA